MNIRLQQAEKIIDELLDWALANRDNENEFVRCYTYGYDPKSGKARSPQCLIKAKKFVGETVDHLKQIK